jgi:hypothetical protein
MSFGTCTHCDHFFALETESSTQRHCPRCRRPLQLLPREEALAALRRIQARCPSRPAVLSPAAEPKARPNIPHGEMATLAGTIVEVVALARSEHPDEGCTFLINALCYAEQSRVAGEPWGDALVQRYHDVLKSFASRYEVRVE